VSVCTWLAWERGAPGTDWHTACESVLAWELSWAGAEHQVFPVFFFFCSRASFFVSALFEHALVHKCISAALSWSPRTHASLARAHAARPVTDAGKSNGSKGSQACWDTPDSFSKRSPGRDRVIRHSCVLSLQSFWHARVWWWWWCSLTQKNSSANLVVVNGHYNICVLPLPQ